MSADSQSPMPPEEIEQRITAFIERELLTGGTTITRDDNLLTGEIIDSIGVFRLATFIEEEFQIVIEPTDFVIENFENVAVLSRYVTISAGGPGNPPDASGE